MELIIEIVKLGTVGLIAGLFSAYVATRGHRNKKWWELRVEAYKSVIESLSDINYYYNVLYKAKIESRNLSKEYEEELSKFQDDSYHKIRKAADTGSFLFSESAKKALKEFIDLNKEDYFLYLDSYSAGAEKCLKRVVLSSNKDLRVKDSWF